MSYLAHCYTRATQEKVDGVGSSGDGMGRVTCPGSVLQSSSWKTPLIMSWKRKIVELAGYGDV